MTYRIRRSRSFVLLFAVAALVIASISPVAAASPDARTGGKILPHRGPDRSTTVFTVPNGVIGFKSYLGWVYSDDSIAVVGEVLNNTGTRLKEITIKVTYFASTDPGAPVLGSHSDLVALDRVSRGGVGPFAVYDQTPPTGVGAFQIEIILQSDSDTTAAAGGGLDITTTASYVNTGTRWYPGTVHNPNTFAVDAVRVILTAYDSSGNAGEVMWDEPVGPIPAGGSAGFLIGIADDFGPNFTMSKVKFLADGVRDDQTSVYVTSWANYFDDLYQSTFREDIVWLAEQDITRGCGAGKYCPNASVSRGQMASFLVRALDLPSTPTDYFTDDNGTTHEVSINRVAAAGITTGCAPNLYCPDDDVSRGQMASFLARAFALPSTATDYFTDDNGTTHEGNINRVAAAGITTGCSATTYCPKADVTRGQMAAFLRRALED